MLTDFQGCEEQLVSEAQDGMRKHVVFESSSLANQQYDLQMLFKVTCGTATVDMNTFGASMCDAYESNTLCFWTSGTPRMGRV